MTAELLPIAFKGSRDYIAGADVFDAVGAWLDRAFGFDQIHDVTFTFKRFARRRVRLEVPGVTADCVASIHFGSRDGAVAARLIETEHPIVDRRPYPEERILERCAIDVGGATCEADTTSGFTTIEHLVAMNKALHHACFPVSTRQWLLVRLDVPRYIRPVGYQRLEVLLTQRLGDKLTKSAMHVDGHFAGHMFFSSKAA